MYFYEKSPQTLLRVILVLKQNKLLVLESICTERQFLLAATVVAER